MNEEEQQRLRRKVIEQQKLNDRIKVIAVTGWCMVVLTFFLAVGFFRFIYQAKTIYYFYFFKIKQKQNKQ